MISIESTKTTRPFALIAIRAISVTARTARGPGFAASRILSEGKSAAAIISPWCALARLRNRFKNIFQTYPDWTRVYLHSARGEAASHLDISYIAGAAVPSDHLATGITNSVIGSGPSRNWGFSVTGESGRSAPQAALSVNGK